MKINSLNCKKCLSLLVAICFVITMQPLGANRVFAAVNELNLALNVPGGVLSFINDPNKPWVVDDTSSPGRVSAKSNIAGISNGGTTLTLSAGTLQANKVLHFDWDVSSETDKDTLYFIVNGTPNKWINGQTGSWSTVKFIVPSTGSYTFQWTYQKDNAVDSGADSAWLDNVKIADFVPVESVIVTPSVAWANIRFTTQFSASVVPADATIQEVTWASSNTAVATVDSNGLVTGVAEGQAYIVATPKDPLGSSGESVVNVNAPIQTTGVSLNYTSGTLLVGDTGTLVATLTPQYASYRNISWVSDDIGIATVTVEAGIVKVRGKAPGKTKIRALTETGNFTAACTITVIAESALQDQTHLTYTQVSLDSTMPVTLGWHISEYMKYSRPPLIPSTTAKGFSVYLEAGKKVRFETGGPTNVDTYLDLYDSNFNRLAFDDDEGSASFSLIEQFTVPQTGIYKIVVSGYSYSAAGSFNLYVTEIPPIPVTGVAFSQGTFTVPLNYTLPLPVSVLPLDADNQGLTFTSSNPGSITVNAAGEVTGVSSGNSLITATSVQGGFVATCLVSVGYTAVQSVSFNTDAVIVGLNKTKTLQYVIAPADAQLRGVSFISKNTSVATVNATGVITAVGLGNAVIEVTTADGGFKDTCSVKVVAVNISTSASITLIAGDVWGDGTGYQLLLDADADAYGRLFQKSGALNMSGNVPNSVYDQFEIKIPSNANGMLTTSNIVVNNSVTILIPAGVYDFCIANPVPGDKVWIADTNASSPGRYNNYNFEAGYSYTFVMTNNGSPIPSFKRDVTTLTKTYTGAGLSKYAVNYSVAGSGGALVGKTSLLAEEGYTLTAADMPVPTPNDGYHFTGWNANPIGTTVNAPISFTCTFAINKYTVVFKDWNNVTIATQENVPHGTAATPPPSPNSRPDWHFVGWSPSFSAVTGNMVVTAQYEIDAYAVNLPTGTGYTALPEGTSSSPVSRGGNFTFTVALLPQYSNSVIVVKSNGATLTAVRNVYTIANVTENKTVTVTGVVPNNAVYTALDAAVALSPAWADHNYTTPTITAFRNAVTAGQNIARNLNTFSQPLIDAATAAIVSAYNGLVLKPANYTALDIALALTPAYNDIYYTPATIATFRNALSAGQSVSRMLNITQQSTVDNATAAINSALAGLVLRPAQTQFVLKTESELSINRTNNSVTGISLRANAVAEVLSEFTNFAIITVTDMNGVPLSANDLVGTGSVVSLLGKDGTVVDQVTVVVYGDTDGDGLADGRDATIADMIASGMLTLLDVGEYVYAAADANRDGQIDNEDVALLEQAGLFLVDIG